MNPTCRQLFVTRLVPYFLIRHWEHNHEPWKITKLGLNLGLDSWICWISAFNLSRMLLAMAVPSIFVAVMATLEAEKSRLEDDREPNVRWWW